LYILLIHVYIHIHTYTHAYTCIYMAMIRKVPVYDKNGPPTRRGAASGVLTASLATLTASALALTGTALDDGADSDDLDDYSFEGG
jgi:hypothetical protein